MAVKGQASALGRIEGVREATLCGPDGSVLESSSNQPELAAAAVSLTRALSALEANASAFAPPVTLTVDTEQGSLHCIRMADAILVVLTSPEANLGAVRLEMRDAARALAQG